MEIATLLAAVNLPWSIYCGLNLCWTVNTCCEAVSSKSMLTVCVQTAVVIPVSPLIVGALSILTVPLPLSPAIPKSSSISKPSTYAFKFVFAVSTYAFTGLLC